jgi:hypothetical protein
LRTQDLLNDERLMSDTFLRCPQRVLMKETYFSAASIRA